MRTSEPGAGFEPATSALQEPRSAELSYPGGVIRVSPVSKRECEKVGPLPGQLSPYGESG